MFRYSRELTGDARERPMNIEANIKEAELKRKLFCILFALVLVLVLTLVPATTAVANDVPS